MCTKEEVKQATTEAIHEYMTEENGDGLTVVEKEMQDVLNASISKVIFRFGVALVSIVVAGTIGWLEVKNDVSDNTVSRTAGDRYTQEEADAHLLIVDERFVSIRNDMSQLRTDYKDDVREIKGDIKFIREKLGG